MTCDFGVFLSRGSSGGFCLLRCVICDLFDPRRLRHAQVPGAGAYDQDAAPIYPSAPSYTVPKEVCHHSRDPPQNQILSSKNRILSSQSRITTNPPPGQPPRS